MLRRFSRTTIIALSKAAWAQRLVSRWSVARRVVSRFVAGETLEQAISVIRALNDRGIMTTLDHLGENTTSVEEAHSSTREILVALEAISTSGIRSNVSIKLSQLGLLLDETICRENLEEVLRRASGLHIFIRIDMEDSSLTARTLEIVNWAWNMGFTNMGVVIQAYLYRSEEDVKKLLARSGRVRLCKGAYDEPAAVAFPRKQDVDANYDRIALQLMQGALRSGSPHISSDGRIPPIPAFATHDYLRIQWIKAEAQRLGISKGAIEFQMLFGIRRDLQDQLVGEGYPVRVYVPYGTHWYPYFMRRLAERPANLWFFVSNFFQK